MPSCRAECSRLFVEVAGPVGLAPDHRTSETTARRRLAAIGLVNCGQLGLDEQSQSASKMPRYRVSRS